MMEILLTFALIGLILYIAKIFIIISIIVAFIILLVVIINKHKSKYCPLCNSKNLKSAATCIVCGTPFENSDIKVNKESLEIISEKSQ